MFYQLSNTEKISIAVSSFVLAIVALLVSLKLSLAQGYSDFIVGNITWSASTKYQDLIAWPLFVIVLCGAFWSLSYIITKQRTRFGDDYADKLVSQLILWTLPFFAAAFSLVFGSGVENKLFAVSAVGIGTITILSAYGSYRDIEICPKIISVSVVFVFIIGLIPLEIALLLGRADLKIIGEIDVGKFIKYTYVLTSLTFLSLTIFWVSAPRLVLRKFNRVLLLGQIGLPLFFIALYPAELALPDGVITSYKTTGWLKLFVIGLVLLGLFDVIRRYYKYGDDNEEWIKLLSPISLFALIIGLRVGNTITPHISPDDYHFGEGLLGWWSYFQGKIPYVDYMPAHGLIGDDFTGFLSYLFYDGSAGSLADASRVNFAILGLVAFISIYLYSGSILLAFVSALFMTTSFGRHHWIYVVPFICLWLSRSLRQSPSKWIAVWLLTAPITILGVPPQGLLLVAASSVLGFYFLWRILKNSEDRSWKEVGISIAVVFLLCLFMPILEMLSGAILYVIENGAVNQVAYGIPWRLSWNDGASSGVVFEFIRMSWVVIAIACLSVVYSSIADIRAGRNPYCHRLRYEYIGTSAVILLFAFLLIPYSMGRIDPNALSRPGVAAVFGWSVLLPILLWKIIGERHRSVLLLVIVCFCSALNFYPHPFSALASASSPKIATAPLKDGEKAGLPNIGKAIVEEGHWQRLIRLNNLLRDKLSENESYLDLTSRNAQYFYLDRLPLVSVTAPYNLVSPVQQKREVASLKNNVPRVALIEGDNIIHDGGGLALRNPYLYQFVVDNYIPRLEDGFIIGYRKSDKGSYDDLSISVAIKNITDTNWDHGFGRHKASVVLDDQLLTTILSAGAKVQLNNGEVRNIVDVTGEAIWLDGDTINAPLSGSSHVVNVLVSGEVESEYRALLFKKAFGQPDFHKIPVAWGRSIDTLIDKMSMIDDLSDISPIPSQLVAENGGYKVAGADPYLIYDLSAFGLSGSSADLLKIDFSCQQRTSDPRIQIFWWGDAEAGPTEGKSIKFTADDGVLIVPLYAAPQWQMTNRVAGIRIDLDNPSSCRSLKMSNVGLYRFGS